MTRREQITAIVIAISPIVYIPFADWVATTPMGTRLLKDFELAYGLALLVSVFAIPVLLIRLGFSRERARPAFYLLLCVVFIPCFFGGLVLGHHARMAGMRSFAHRSKPLIAAI